MNETDGAEDVPVRRVPTQRFVAIPKLPGESSAPAAPDAMRSPPERRRALLLKLRGAHPGELFSLQSANIVIGRAGEADIHVIEPTASWHHLRLVTRNGGVHAEDLSSTNGTFVNEQRIERSTLLTDGDYVRLGGGGGGTVFKFCMMEEFEERALRGIFLLAGAAPRALGLEAR